MLDNYEVEDDNEKDLYLKKPEKNYFDNSDFKYSGFADGGDYYRQLNDNEGVFNA